MLKGKSTIKQDPQKHAPAAKRVAISLLLLSALREFHAAAAGAVLLPYCEHEITPLLVGRISAQRYHNDVKAYRLFEMSDVVFFNTEELAEGAGFQRISAAADEVEIGS